MAYILRFISHFSISLHPATTDRQDLTHSEQEQHHIKLDQNEVDAISPEPAEEHQDTADNTTQHPAEERHYDADTEEQHVEEHHDAAYSIPHHPASDHHNDADVSLRPVADHHHDAGISQHPVEELHNATYSISLQPVEELQDGTMRLSHQMDVEGRSKQDKTDHQTYKMPPHPKKDDLTVRMSHSVPNQQGTLAIRTQPHVETPRLRKADDDMARILNVQGHSYNHSKTRRRRGR